MLTIWASPIISPRHDRGRPLAALLVVPFLTVTFFTVAFFLLPLLWEARVASAPHEVTWPSITLKTISNGFVQPVDVVSANDGTDRLFVVQRGGLIYVIENGIRLETPFLNIAARVSDTAPPCYECGLLGLAFPPDFAEGGYFFVYYTSGIDLVEPDTGDPDPPDMGDSVLARFQVTNNPNVADADSEDPILLINEPEKNHNGGHLLFGPDNFLYIGTGDGGGTGDEFANAQDPASLHGKLLRIEVGATGTYTIPASNPFTTTEGYRGEIWAMGLRNPWRFNFDPITGDLYIADVGQGTHEEINYIAKDDIGNGGMNFGWPILEGNICYPPNGPQNCDRTGLIAPIATYDHSLGDCSVTGGHVFRTANQDLAPVYLYGDYCSGRLWGLQREGANWVSSQLEDFDFQITSFGEDRDENLYLVSYAGTIYAIKDTIAGLSAANNGPAEVNTPVSFSASVTSGSGITYTWDFGDGNVGSGITTTHTYTPSGVYTATVVATNDTDTMSATTTVYIGDAVVNVTSNNYTPRAITLPDGGKVVWVLQGGTHSVTADDGTFNQPAGSNWPPFIQEFSPPASGASTANLAAIFNYYCTLHGAPGGIGMTGSVTVGNASPITGLTASNDGPTQVNEPTGFAASVTGGTDVAYSWDFGDGNAGNEITTTHTYTQAGIYTATVTATNATNSMSATSTVYIGDAVVDVTSNTYSPRDVTVPVGGKVVWVLQDGFHSVTADDGTFNQPAVSNWPPFVQTFETADQYPYHCTIHGAKGGIGMAGSVTVGSGVADKSELHLPSLWKNGN